MTYPLLDHCNARNAAELARCGDDPKCSQPCNTKGLTLMPPHFYFPADKINP